VRVNGKIIFYIVIDEGALTCIMSIACWKSFVSPNIVPFNTMLKAFDGHILKPHGIIISFPIELGGNTISVEVEVVDAPLEYNLLLRNTWFYKMTVVVSSLSRVLLSPHQGNIITIDQLAFCTLDLRINEKSNIPFVGNFHNDYSSVSVGMFKYSLLMGTFSFPTTSRYNYLYDKYDLFIFQWLPQVF
jgi:hypothetical protein